MDQLHRDAGFHRPTVACLAELGREKGQEGAEALAAGEQQVLGDLGQVGVVSRCRLEQSLLDAGEGVPHPRDPNEPLEVVHS